MSSEKTKQANIISQISPPFIDLSSPCSQVQVREYLEILMSLIALVLGVSFFQLETNLYLLTTLKVVTVGFAIHTLLPLPQRLPFYFLLSCGTMILIFGWQISLMVIILVFLYFGITTLPLGWRTKVGLTLFLTLFLLAIRTHLLSFSPSLVLATKVTGIMLVFRSILYLYEIKHEKTRPATWLRINYFFLLPSPVFFLFPIVDYKTFTRGYYDQPAIINYRRGVHWIFRGIIHLLVYRILQYYFLPSVSEVLDIYDLLQYFGVAYALILRLSGIFHISAGIICLFGFNLPKTFDNYFLTSSFSDIWHRINIYWKDFVMKVFYFPIYFQFKKRDNRAVFITILIVFFFNWFMHAYQWLWIKGNFLLSSNDMIFWAALGLFVAINTIVRKKGRKKQPNVDTFQFGPTLLRSFKIIGMYGAMSLLWGFWISPGIRSWFDFITGITQPTVGDLLLVSTAVCVLALMVTTIFYLGYALKWSEQKNSFWLVRNRVTLGLVLLVGMGLTSLSPRMLANYPLDMQPVFAASPNTDQQSQIFRGYYDELIVSNNFNSREWEIKLKEKPARKNLIESGIGRPADGILLKELVPDKQAIFREAEITTNASGLRDKDYPLQQPEGYLRIALLGGSMEMGSGVNDDETFEHLLEIALNEQQLFDDYQGVELINFAVSGIHLPQHVGITEAKVLPFSPDVLIYTAHFNEVNRAARIFGQTIAVKDRVKAYPYLYNLSEALNLRESMDVEEMLRRLRPYRIQLYNWGLERIATACQEHNIIPIYLYLAAPGDDKMEDEISLLRKLATDKGFYFIDQSDIFQGLVFKNLTIAKEDKHPNALGHRHIADNLLNVFLQDTIFQHLLIETKK